MEFIATVRKTVQVSEDHWERQTLAATFVANATIAQVCGWAEKVGGDLNTLQIQPNLSNQAG